jgi:hypothetical protein
MRPSKWTHIDPDGPKGWEIGEKKEGGWAKNQPED